MKRGLEICYILMIIALFATGCGILHPATKVDGYYVSHYNSCGPQAIHDAIQHYATVNGIKFKRMWTWKEISQDIQDTKSIIDCRVCMAWMHRDFINITWPHEVKEVCAQYGFTATKLDSLDDFKIGQTGIVLIHRRTSLEYHWVCYPTDDVDDFYGEDKTVILDIFLLTR